ncbi:MAG TPA: DegT/DnrJ/EryC1/StrS family aminotransferase, partial [Rhodocyclaceae bacterium]|nr:DegT/DnrJ/EryC1/StrS family aminotransferase [Rhodocyclaceae bacterium]
DSWALDPDALAACAGADAIIAVHVFGIPAPLAEYRARLSVPIVEDCAQALGGHGDGVALGKTGDMAVFSFYATKIIAGGQGGLVWSADAALTARVDDVRRFDCREDYAPRFNFQLTDIQAALVLSQFDRLEEIRTRRTAIVRRYLASMPAGFSANFATVPAGAMPYRFVLKAAGADLRERLWRHMSERQIGCIVPVARHELLHRYLGLSAADYPVAEELADTTLSLPLYPALGGRETDLVCEALESFRP